MTKTKDEPQNTNTEQTTILEQTILEKLGTPPNFSHINAINIFDTRWRVNVYDKQPGFIEKRTIVASFYVILNKKGEIKSPEIKKQF